MIRRFLFIATLWFLGLTVSAQSMKLNFNSEALWPNISHVSISSDGHFVLYLTSYPDSPSTLTVQRTDNGSKFAYSGVKEARFTEDNCRVVAKLGSDSLLIFNLETNENKFLSHVVNFGLPLRGVGEWYGYERTDSVFVLGNFYTKATKEFPSVCNFQFSAESKILVLQARGEVANSGNFKIIFIDLGSGKIDTIFESRWRASDFSFDRSESQLAFIGKDSLTGKLADIIMYYKRGMGNSVQKVNGKTPGMEGYSVSRTFFSIKSPSFSPNGRRLLFSVKIKENAEINNSGSSLGNPEIWKVRDTLLESVREKLFNSQVSLPATIELEGDRKVVILRTVQDYPNVQLDRGGDGNYALLFNNALNSHEAYWRTYSMSDLCLVSLDDGSRKKIALKQFISWSGFSPSGKFVVWYDMAKRNYFSYDIRNGVIVNVTKGIPFPMYDDENDEPTAPPHFGVMGWYCGDQKILVYDRFDVWGCDPSGITPPVNLSGGYGRRRNTVLRYISVNNMSDEAALFNDSSSIILSAFNRLTKYNGFVRLALGGKYSLTELTMSPYAYCYPSRFPQNDMPSGFIEIPSTIVAAGRSEGYVVSRMSAEEFPNLYFTSDFKKFNRLTEYAPEKAFNWLKSDLVNFRLSNGKRVQGLLYKPGNFSPAVKYPIIFYLYEKVTDCLNEYIRPELSGGTINIPFYTSNGYLVFVPDISYKIGKPGESVLKTVASAIKYLSRFSWIDTSRMGIQGHSFGGYEVNYIVSHANYFKAAVSAAGLADLIAETFTFESSGQSRQYKAERQQLRIGGTLWERQKEYIENSPIFSADKVNTPILIMHNKNDGNVSWQQGLSWYLALRRLNKDAWMLDYEGEVHVLLKKANKLDYSKKVFDYFNYFLKGDAKPKWMY